MDMESIVMLLLCTGMLVFAFKKLRNRENRVVKWLVIYTSVLGTILTVMRSFSTTSSFLVIALPGIAGLLILFGYQAWQRRHDPEVRPNVFWYFVTLALLVVFLITGFILSKMGYFG